MGSKRSGSRPRYNAEVHATIIRYLRTGAYKVHAAQAAGISIDALEDWLKRGRAGDKKYAELVRDVDKALAEDAIRKQAVITKAAMAGDWKPAAWELERKYPRLYGHAATPAVGVTIGHGGDGDGDASGQRTTVQFYLPSNGRRPGEDED